MQPPVVKWSKLLILFMCPFAPDLAVTVCSKAGVLSVTLDGARLLRMEASSPATVCMQAPAPAHAASANPEPGPEAGPSPAAKTARRRLAALLFRKAPGSHGLPQPAAYATTATAPTGATVDGAPMHLRPQDLEQVLQLALVQRSSLEEQQGQLEEQAEGQAVFVAAVKALAVPLGVPAAALHNQLHQGAGDLTVAAPHPAHSRPRAFTIPAAAASTAAGGACLAMFAGAVAVPLDAGAAGVAQALAEAQAGEEGAGAGGDEGALPSDHPLMGMPPEERALFLQVGLGSHVLLVI